MGRPDPGMTLQKLRFAVAAADKQSFLAAADLCCVVPECVSVGIMSLERELGCKLFERLRNGRKGCRVRVTPIGAEVIALARQTLALAQGIKDTAKRHHHQQRDSKTQ